MPQQRKDTDCGAGGIGFREDGISSENPTVICHLHSSLRVTLSQWLSWLNNRQQEEAKLLGVWEQRWRWEGGGGRERDP